MTKLFKNSKAVLSVALALAVLAVSLFTGVVINTEAACSSAEGTTIYWDGTKASKFYADTDGASAENPIIIDTVAELAYVASATYADTNDKYFKIADGISKIVLQSEAIGAEILNKDSASAVQTYFAGIIADSSATKPFTWVCTDWNIARMCFAGNFDGNGAEIYGLYASDASVEGSGANSNMSGSLFGIVDGAHISNFALKNSYVNLRSGAASWKFGLIAAYAGSFNGVDKDLDSIVYIDSCIVANNYVYKETSNSSTVGTLLGSHDQGAFILQNVLVYGNDVTAYDSGKGENYDMPIYGSARNSLNPTDEFKAAHPEITYVDNCVKSVIENSLVLDNALHATYADGTYNVAHRVSGCKSDYTCFEGLYTNWDIASLAETDFFKASQFEAKGGHIINAADAMGEAAAQLTDLDWSIWMIDPEGYPVLRSTHKNVESADNGDGTHSDACECGVHTLPVAHTFVEGACECGAEINCATKKTIYWSGTKDETLADDGETGTSDSPIIIDSAEELAYLLSSPKAVSNGKHFEVADNIGKIVLQSEDVGADIVDLADAQAVKNYFKSIVDAGNAPSTLKVWVGTTWNPNTMCFAGNFDGNGVEIYGMYATDNLTPNSGGITSNTGGLFGIVDGATISNVTLKNSYANVGAAANGDTVNKQTASNNYRFGLLTSYGEGEGIVYINNCVVANNYAYKYTYLDNSGTTFYNSGVVFGGGNIPVIMQNLMVYGNEAIGCFVAADNSTEEYDLSLVGKPRNGMTPSSEFQAAHPEWVSDDGCIMTVLENSVVLGTPLVAVLSDGTTNAVHRVLSCRADVEAVKNVYTDWELQEVGSFNPNYFLENCGAVITEADAIGEAATELNLDWDVWMANADGYPELRVAHDDELIVEPDSYDEYAGHVGFCSCEFETPLVEHDYDANYYCAACDFTCDHRNEDYVTFTPVGGDCLTAASRHGVCACGFEATVPAGSAPGHDFEYHEVDPSADCQTNGTDAYNYCPNCDKKYAADADIDEPFENAITDEDLVLAPAACVALDELGWDDNNHWEVCETCGEIIGGSTQTHTGTWEADLVDPASGHTGACEACDYVANDVQDHDFNGDSVCDLCTWECVDHDFVPDEENGVIESGDCTIDRVVKTFCTICGVQGENKVTTAPGHTEGDVQIENEVPATCTVDGSHDEVIYCTECTQEVERTNVPDTKTGHEFSEYGEDPATCSWDGTKAHVWCSSCGHYFAADHDLEDIYSEAYLEWETDLKIEIDPDAHAWVEVEASDATCDEDGNVEFKFCEYCDTVVVGEDTYQAVIDYDTFYEEVDAVWTEEYEKFTAENEEPGEDATDEEWEEFYDAWNDVWQPIYYSMYEQAIIDAVAEEVTITVDALGHTLKEVAEVAATTEKEGTKAHWVCEDCDKLYADKDGKTEVTAEELVIAKLAKVEDNKTENTDKNTESPKTGETVATAVAAVAAIVAAGYVLVRKARKA